LPIAFTQLASMFPPKLSSHTHKFALRRALCVRGSHGQGPHRVDELARHALVHAPAHQRAVGRRVWRVAAHREHVFLPPLRLGQPDRQASAQLQFGTQILTDFCNFWGHSALSAANAATILTNVCNCHLPQRAEPQRVAAVVRRQTRDTVAHGVQIGEDRLPPDASLRLRI
jgi:hypothetical protein